MNDVTDYPHAVRRALRAIYGVNCPRCALVRPGAFPSRLIPKQRCKVDDYQDPRPRLTDEQRTAAIAQFHGRATVAYTNTRII